MEPQPNSKQSRVASALCNESQFAQQTLSQWQQRLDHLRSAHPVQNRRLQKDQQSVRRDGQQRVARVSLRYKVGKAMQWHML
jgi:hypothetical protein